MPNRIRQLKGPDTSTAIVADGRPRTFTTNGRRHRVEAVLDTWRIEDEWWTADPIDRVYFEVVLDTGRKVIFWAPPEILTHRGELAVYPSS